MCTPANVQSEVDRIRAEIEAVRIQKRERLRTMDFFCLDNSLRESTVGQLRSHTLENKKAIYKEIKKAGLTDVIVASFAQIARIDDDFCQWLVSEGEDMSGNYSFSEVSEGIEDGTYDTDSVPVSLSKNLTYGIANTIFEVDLASDDVEWGVKFTTEDLCQLIFKWIKWVHDNHSDASPRILLNLRDFPYAMTNVPERALEIVTFLAKLPQPYQMFGIAYEDAFGEFLPEELEAWTGAIRRTMDSNGWTAGKLLVHVHQKWDLQTAAQLDCLSAGADGVWASMCDEGAALGHASSVVTMMNLIRMGNEKILSKYNCKYFREGAFNVTKITTGVAPHPKQCIYGARAADLVFGFLGVGDFDVAEFFGVEPPVRITTLASPQMLVDRLVDLFGPNEAFTIEIGKEMKKNIMADLKENRKEEYMSKAGIAILFDRSGGQLTAEMGELIASEKVSVKFHEEIISEIRELWDKWDHKERRRGRPGKKGDECLSFDSFYHGFMAPYFGCYRCTDTKKAFQAIDMDSDGSVDWSEFMVYIKWALRQYPNIRTADEVIETAFQKGLIPAMRDVKLQNKSLASSTSFRFNKK